MNWAETFVGCFKENNLRLVTYVPDVVLQQIVGRVGCDPFFETVSLTREEEGVGILSGAYLGGVRGILLMQSSGFGNCLNALGSLAIAHQIPFLMLLNPRGESGEFNPAQIPMGKALKGLLDALGVQHFTIEHLDHLAVVCRDAVQQAYTSRLPVALLASRLLTGGKNE